MQTKSQVSALDKFGHGLVSSLDDSNPVPLITVLERGHNSVSNALLPVRWLPPIAVFPAPLGDGVEVVVALHRVAVAAPARLARRATSVLRTGGGVRHAVDAAAATLPWGRIVSRVRIWLLHVRTPVRVRGIHFGIRVPSRGWRLRGRRVFPRRVRVLRWSVVDRLGDDFRQLGWV